MKDTYVEPPGEERYVVVMHILEGLLPARSLFIVFPFLC